MDFAAHAYCLSGWVFSGSPNNIVNSHIVYRTVACGLFSYYTNAHTGDNVEISSVQWTLSDVVVHASGGPYVEEPPPPSQGPQLTAFIQPPSIYFRYQVICLLSGDDLLYTSTDERTICMQVISRW
jgi:hypothetical protein